MTNQSNLYQDILREISLLPPFLLADALRSLQALRAAHEDKQQRVSSILAFANSWGSMPDEEYKDIWGEISRSRNSMFNRDVDF